MADTRKSANNNAPLVGRSRRRYTGKLKDCDKGKLMTKPTTTTGRSRVVVARLFGSTVEYGFCKAEMRVRFSQEAVIET